jgi:hypothetical protein
MAGFDHKLDQLLRRLIALDEHHLRARHHDVAYLHVGDRQHALEHHQCIAVEKATLAGTTQMFDEFRKISRLARHCLCNTF